MLMKKQLNRNIILSLCCNYRNKINIMNATTYWKYSNTISYHTDSRKKIRVIKWWTASIEMQLYHKLQHTPAKDWIYRSHIRITMHLHIPHNKLHTLRWHRHKSTGPSIIGLLYQTHTASIHSIKHAGIHTVPAATIPEVSGWLTTP